MNACETLIVPNCTVAATEDFETCDYYEEGSDGTCSHYLLIDTDLGAFHRCGSRPAIEESVYSYCGGDLDDPIDPDVDPLQEQEDFAQDGDFFNREAEE